LPQAPTQPLPLAGEPRHSPDFAHLFDGQDGERIDLETREQVLSWLLERFPTEAVAAFTANGFFTEMPEGIALGEHPVLEGRSGLDSVSEEETRNAMIADWEKMLARGTGSHAVQVPDLPTVTVYWLDLRDLHGVIFAVMAGTSVDDLTEQEREVSTILSKPKPRFASMRKDERASIIEVDEAFGEILGWSPEEVAGKRSLDLMHPDDHALAVENWMEMIARPGPARRLRQRMLHKDGSWVWFEITNHNLLPDPDYACVVCDMADISEEMAAQEALRAREQLLDRLTGALPVGVLQIDNERKVVYTNDRLHDILGVPPAEIVDAQLATVVATDIPSLERAIDTVLAEGSNVDVEVGVVLPDTQEPRRCAMSFRALTHDDGAISGAIACIDDVTDSARMRDELKRRATFDELTGCHNRASIVTALEDSVADRRRHAERAVMFVDVDAFKEVNDQYGHAAGDELLRRVARRLLEAVRETDRVGRIGGDEFLVVCPDIGGPEPAMMLAERIADAINDDGGPERIRCRVSIGVAWSAGSDTSADGLVAMADRAMYDSKRRRTDKPTFAPTER
jgi:diguanylate cyclase (GGDEF)-like protein/PAS domain S-box-containing protein